MEDLTGSDHLVDAGSCGNKVIFGSLGGTGESWKLGKVFFFLPFFLKIVNAHRILFFLIFYLAIISDL